MLEVRGLSVSYGKHQALAGVALDVDAGRDRRDPRRQRRRQVDAAQGDRRAGAGRVRARAIVLDGRDLLALPPHEIVEAGIALVPEGRGIFAELTVRENLELGAYRAARARDARRTISSACSTLFPRLAERCGQLARTMSGGEQQMVAIGRALMSAPELLLLDEPRSACRRCMCGELFRALARIRETGVGILLVEQNARQGLNIADRGYLIETGRIVGEGAAARCATIRRCSEPISVGARRPYRLIHPLEIEPNSRHRTA